MYVCCVLSYPSSVYHEKNPFSSSILLILIEQFGSFDTSLEKLLGIKHDFDDFFDGEDFFVDEHTGDLGNFLMEFGDKFVGFFRCLIEFVNKPGFIGFAEILDLVVDDLTEDGTLTFFVCDCIEFVSV